MKTAVQITVDLVEGDGIAMNKIRTWKIWEKKILFSIIGILCVIALVVSMVFICLNSEEDIAYRETVAQFGDLVAGITESGAVDIGTVEQTFNLDMSALQRASKNSSHSTTGNSNTSGGMSGGMSGMGNAGGGMSSGIDMFSQIFNMAGAGDSGSSGSDSTLTVEKVYVSVGQQIKVGDVLYELEEESVTELEEQLQTNIEKAKADLDAVYADQTLSAQTAKYNYESSLAYGGYANTEYNSTLQNLQNTVTTKQTALEQAQESLIEYQEQLTEMQTAYQEALDMLESCKWSAENVDKWANPGTYVYVFNLMQTAQTNVNSVEQKVEQLENNIEQAEENVEMAEKEYQAATRNLAQGTLTAQETRDLRQLAYNTAQETYDIALAYLEDAVSEQETIYQETQDKWEEFSSHISEISVCSQYNGVITGVELAEGDSIGTGTVLISLYNMDEVTMTVTVDEEDMTDIAVGSQANISLTAYPDVIFEAKVSEIGDAETDSSGNLSYDVTVTLEGDVSGLFQGMTGEITFVTNQTSQVIYVSRRAIITDGEDSYVKVKDEKGNVQTRKVTTGFTDGVNVEIAEGISEGEIVLIESKVSGS